MFKAVWTNISWFLLNYFYFLDSLTQFVSYSFLTTSLLFSFKDFSEAFDSLDTSGSGYMTFADVKEKILAKIIRRMGHNPTETELAQYLEDMDTNSEYFVSSYKL